MREYRLGSSDPRVRFSPGHRGLTFIVCRSCAPYGDVVLSVMVTGGSGTVSKDVDDRWRPLAAAFGGQEGLGDQFEPTGRLKMFRSFQLDSVLAEYRLKSSAEFQPDTTIAYFTVSDGCVAAIGFVEQAPRHYETIDRRYKPHDFDGAARLVKTLTLDAVRLESTSFDTRNLVLPPRVRVVGVLPPPPDLALAMRPPRPKRFAPVGELSYPSIPINDFRASLGLPPR
ncbi:hypothetical protein ACFSCV_14620 [Methylopila henanensis]|uniref:Uncharacterized protein n=1 Tax=Methylopila henanensis TaxID=873516 RepID=A0ABW4K7Z2_9HYPH